MMTYQQTMQEKAREFLARLSANPKDFRSHIKQLVKRLLYIVRVLTARQSSGKIHHVCHIWL
jgi:hypothetical protein